MHTRIKAEITALARAAPDQEVCGFIYADSAGRPQILPCPNVAADPTEDFQIDSDDQIRAINRGTIIGVYHSHPDDNAFSPADLDCAEHMAVPFYLATPNQWHSYTPPTYQVSLEGRQFVLGFDDCYGLIRDYYRQRFSHHMSDYDRDESFTHEEQGVIMENWQREGFQLLPPDPLTIREHDILMFRTDKALPQHFAVYLGLNRFLHHPLDALSQTTQLTDRWMSRLVCVFRRAN